MPPPGRAAYQDDNGKPWVLPVVKKMEATLNEELQAGKLNKEYLPVSGLPAFVAASARLALGADHPALAENRVDGLQVRGGGSGGGGRGRRDGCCIGCNLSISLDGFFCDLQLHRLLTARLAYGCSNAFNGLCSRISHCLISHCRQQCPATCWWRWQRLATIPQGGQLAWTPAARLFSILK